MKPTREDVVSAYLETLAEFGPDDLQTELCVLALRAIDQADDAAMGAATRSAYASLAPGTSPLGKRHSHDDMVAYHELAEVVALALRAEVTREG
jgi:hypothetical protein